MTNKSYPNQGKKKNIKFTTPLNHLRISVSCKLTQLNIYLSAKFQILQPVGLVTKLALSTCPQNQEINGGYASKHDKTRKLESQFQNDINQEDSRNLI